MLSDLLQVVICFQISIFEPLETIGTVGSPREPVVICFQISIFEPLETICGTQDEGRDRCDLLSN